MAAVRCMYSCTSVTLRLAAVHVLYNYVEVIQVCIIYIPLSVRQRLFFKGLATITNSIFRKHKQVLLILSIKFKKKSKRIYRNAIHKNTLDAFFKKMQFKMTNIACGKNEPTTN